MYNVKLTANGKIFTGYAAPAVLNALPGTSVAPGGVSDGFLHNSDCL
jgi:hypothetical protein